MHRFLLLFFLLISQLVMAQNPSRYFRLIENNKWEAARELIEKNLVKDSINPVAWYTNAWLSVNDSSYNLPIDSTYTILLLARKQYEESTDGKLLKKAHKAGLDSIPIKGLQLTIEALAFDSAQMNDREEDYIHFLSIYQEADSQRKIAIKRRNELGYQKALEENTPEAFQHFYSKYPDAEQVQNAKQFYETRLYEESTKDKKLSSFQHFLTEYPHTPYRREAEQQIFNIITADGKTGNYQKFIYQYPDSPLSKKALLYIYHMMGRQEQAELLAKSNFTQSVLDSLHELSQLSRLPVFPLLEKGRFRIMDAYGEPLHQLVLNQLSYYYRCEGIKGDLIYEKHDNNLKILNRKAELWMETTGDSLYHLGLGFYIINDDRESKLFHLANRSVRINADRFKLLENRLIAAKRGDDWQISSFQFVPLLLLQNVDSLFSHQGYLFSRKNGRWAISYFDEITALAEPGHFTPDYQYKTISLLAHQLLIAEKENQLGLIRLNGQELFPFGAEKIEQLNDFYFVRWEENNHSIYNLKGNTVADSITAFQERNGLIAIQSDNKWTLLSEQQKLNFEWDSLKVLSSKFAYAENDKGRFIINVIGNKHKLTQNETFGIQRINNPALKAEHQAEYLTIQLPKSHVQLLNDSLKLIYEAEQSSFSILHPLFLSITYRQKKGIINHRGELILPIGKSAIANPSDDLIATLDNQKFGAFDFTNSIHIPNEYEKTISRYTKTDSLYIASKDGLSGIISKSNTVVFPFSFEEISAINDSLAFIKKDRQWQLVNIFSQDSLRHDEINILAPFAENYWLTYNEKGYGIMNHKGETIVPMAYNTIVNVGDESMPVFMCERHIAEADYFISIYYRFDGELIYKNAYEPAEYEQIFCDDF